MASLDYLSCRIPRNQEVRVSTACGNLEKAFSLILTGSCFGTVLLRNFEIETFPQVSLNVFYYYYYYYYYYCYYYFNYYHLSRFAFQFCCFGLVCFVLFSCLIIIFSYHHHSIYHFFFKLLVVIVYLRSSGQEQIMQLNQNT